MVEYGAVEVELLLRDIMHGLVTVDIMEVEEVQPILTR